MGKGHQSSGHAPGDFDVWLLAQTWSPHFCCAHTDRCHTVPWAFSAKHLSLHGLWPGFLTQRGGETFPSSCATSARLVPTQLPREYIDVAPSFTTWNAAERRAEVGDLAKHEWKKVSVAPSVDVIWWWWWWHGGRAQRAQRGVGGYRGVRGRRERAHTPLVESRPHRSRSMARAVG